MISANTIKSDKSGGAKCADAAHSHKQTTCRRAACETMKNKLEETIELIVTCLPQTSCSKVNCKPAACREVSMRMDA